MKNKAKKTILPLMVILGMGLIMAIGYYAMVTIQLNINQPISVTGDLEQEIDCDAGSICYGNPITTSNDGDDARTIILSDDNINEDVTVSYVGFLKLTEKVVDFGNEPWVIPVDAEEAEVEFTLIDDEFSAKVTEGDEIEGYVLIYYKDSSDRWETVGEGILMDDVSANLPYETDGNYDENDYCTSGEYDTCFGAKIWYVPETALDEGELDWSKASEFLFETFLIQYNSDGEFIVYPDSSITFVPKFDIDNYAEEGLADLITITVA